MSVLSLHHVNLRVSALELQLLREFYCDALGLSVGWRPPFKSNGLWLYAGDIPIVHLVETTEAVPAIERGAAARVTQPPPVQKGASPIADLMPFRISFLNCGCPGNPEPPVNAAASCPNVVVHDLPPS